MITLERITVAVWLVNLSIASIIGNMVFALVHHLGKT